jgi:hypothetical protein
MTLSRFSSCSSGFCQCLVDYRILAGLMHAMGPVLAAAAAGGRCRFGHGLSGRLVANLKKKKKEYVQGQRP